MEIGGTLDWGITGILILATILFFMGKGDFLFNGMKGGTRDMNQSYDIPRLKRTCGFITLILTLVQLAVNFLGPKIEFLMWIYIPVVVIVFVVAIFMVKKCKK